MPRTPLTRRAPGLVGTLLGLLAGTAGAQSAIDVTLDDGRLTLRTSATPAEQLADALRDATGINFVITGETATPLSADFSDEPLDKAIALIAPNHMLVREDARPDAPIVEVVMMMPDAGDSGSDSTEFLPSGGPADDQTFDEQTSAEQNFNAEPGGPQEVEYDQNGLPIDPAVLRDPGRAEAARLEADSLEATPELDGFDPEPEIDPATGEILQR